MKLKKLLAAALSVVMMCTMPATTYAAEFSDGTGYATEEVDIQETEIFSDEKELQVDSKEIYENNTPNAGIQPAITEDGLYEYIGLYDGTVAITKYLGNDKDIILPTTIQNRTVSALAGFSSTVQLRSIRGDSIRSIGNNNDGSQSRITTAENINFPNLTYIGDAVFIKNSNLKKLELPKLMQTYEYAFYGCTSLEEVNCPNLCRINTCAFMDCTNLRRVILSDSVYFGVESFKNDAKLSQIIFTHNEERDVPEGMGFGAFMNCTSLKEITLPSQYDYSIANCAIGFYEDGAFYNKIPGFKIHGIVNDPSNEAYQYAIHNGFLGDVHEHEYELYDVDDSVCHSGSGGWLHYKCKTCGKINDKLVPPGHKWSEGEIITPATAVSLGKRKRICEYCGEVFYELVSRLRPTGKLNKTSVTFKVNQTYTPFKVTGLAYGDSVKSYSSSNKKVFIVTSKGKITAKAPGTAKLTITLASGKQLRATVKVVKSVKTTKLTVNKKSVTLTKGKTFQLKAVCTPSNSTEKITYSSSKKSVATVTSKGKITAKGKGTAYITVKSGGKSVKIKVIVK